MQMNHPGFILRCAKRNQTFTCALRTNSTEQRALGHHQNAGKLLMANNTVEDKMLRSQDQAAS
jgi:hypothetical protein